MKTKSFVALLILILAIVPVFAQQPDGLTCETAIPVDTSFVGSIPSAGTYYFSASTYDLPMTCYFYPESPVNQSPKVYVDFTCTPGVYDDPNIVEMLKAGTGWGIELPLILSFTSEYEANGDVYYSLTIGDMYRLLMAQYNITYNVNAFVKVDAPCAGQIRMAPDTTFKSCVENSKWLNLPDTIITGFQHESDSYVLPFADWKNDSIRFRWTGTEPVTVWIGENCDFEFKTVGSNCALDMFVLYPDAGNQENIRVFSKQEINDYISLFGVGGVYYLRTACSENGKLIVEKKPVDATMAKAKKLVIDQPSNVKANDVEQVYYFPTTWENNNMIFTSSSDYQLTAYFSKNINFTADVTDANVVAVHPFIYTGAGRELVLSKKQLKSICNSIAGDNVFVKFVAAQKTNVTPILWSAGPCAENADVIYPNDSVRLQRNASSTAWRINIDQWAEQDVKMYWKGTSSIKVFLCDTCKGFTLNKANERVKLYKEVNINNDGTRDTLLLTKEELSELVQYADADGFMYFRFNNSAAGSLITIANVYEPEPEPEPEPQPQDLIPLVLDSTINLEADDIENTYYITRAWENLSVEFITNAADSVYAYFGTTPDFEIYTDQPEYLAVHPFYIEGKQSHLQLSKKQVNSLFQATNADTIYVVFHSYYKTQLTPMAWNACRCAENSLEIKPRDQHALLANAAGAVFRIRYSQWKDHDVNLHWASDVMLYAFLADTCDFYLTATDYHVFNYDDVDIAPNGTMVIGDVVRDEAIFYGRLPENGFLYFRFYSEAPGLLTTSYEGAPQGPSVPDGPTTGVDNTTTDKPYQLYIAPDGHMYLLVGGKRYTILGQSLE